MQQDVLTLHISVLQLHPLVLSSNNNTDDVKIPIIFTRHVIAVHTL